jgi:hypothetical protein
VRHPPISCKLLALGLRLGAAILRPQPSARAELAMAATLENNQEGGLQLRTRVSRQMDGVEMSKTSITIPDKTRMGIAFALAVAADVLQIALFPLFIEGAASPVDDIVDVGVAGGLSFLGWHWEFLPSFFAKLVPGVDFIPLWTMAVANVYRRSRRGVAVSEEVPQSQVIEGDAVRRGATAR